MKTYLSVTALIWIMLLPFYSKAQTGNSSMDSIPNFKIVDSFIRDIPLTKRGKPGYDYRYVRELEQRLNLKPLQNGYDSLEIRLWFDYFKCDTSQLVILKNSNGKWDYELINFEYQYNGAADSILGVNKQSITAEPKSGWNTVIGKLFALKINTLIECYKIPNYPEFTDGYSVTVEISTIKKYRLYDYSNPGLANEVSKKKIWQATNIEAIFRLLENEFSFKLLRNI